MRFRMSPITLRRANTVAPSCHPISTLNRLSPRVKRSPRTFSKKGSEKEQTKQTSQRKKNTLISRLGLFTKKNLTVLYRIIEVNTCNECVSGIPQFYPSVYGEQSIVLIRVL